MLLEKTRFVSEVKQPKVVASSGQVAAGRLRILVPVRHVQEVSALLR